MLGLTTLVLCSLTLSPAPCALCEDRCYLVLFGGQAGKVRPRTAHTWATFVKGNPQRVESFTISWLPVRLPVRPCRLFPEPGRNYGLHETLDLFNTGRQEIGMWGPYEIQPSWCEQARAHKQLLDSGAVKFQTMDRGPLRPGGPVRRPDISHCVHAVTRTNNALRESTSPVFSYGEYITRKVADQMNEEGLLVHPEQTHDWLITALDLERYHLTRRRVGEPVLRVLR